MPIDRRGLHPDPPDPRFARPARRDPVGDGARRRQLTRHHTDGLDAAMLEAVSTVLEDGPTIDAVYSVGGATRFRTRSHPKCRVITPYNEPRAFAHPE